MIETETVRDDYVGGGTTADYDFTFKVFDEEHLTVLVTDPDEEDAETELVLNVDYEVDGVGDEGGGTITLLNASQDWIDGSGFLDDDWGLAIIRDIPNTQTTDFRNQGDYYPEGHENAFDKLVMMVQQLKNELDRCIKVPASEDVDDLETPSVDARASKYFAFDADGNPVASDLTTSTALVSSYAQTLLDDTTAAAARTTLGFSGASGTAATANIEDLAVTTAKINDLGVTTAKLAANSITKAKLDNSLIHDMTEVDPALGDFLSIADISDSNKIKKVLVSKIKNLAYRAVTTTDGATSADEWLYFSSASFTETLVTAVGNVGKVMFLQHAGTSISQVYTIASAGGNVDGASTSTLNTAGEVLCVRSNGTDWIKVFRYIPATAITFTPTGSWSTNTTYTGVLNRRGHLADIDIKVAVSGAPDSASLTVTLPITIATTDLLDTTAGVAGWRGSVAIRDASADNFIGFIRYSSTTAIAIHKDDGDGTVSAVTQAAPMTFASGDFVHIQLSGVPVNGWKT